MIYLLNQINKVSSTSRGRGWPSDVIRIRSSMTRLAIVPRSLLCGGYFYMKGG